MRLEVYFTIPELDPGTVEGATAVVVDVVRATTTIVEALANGAEAVYPVETPEDAVRLANSLGRDRALVCGERKGLKVDGFDLGNSPREYGEAAVAGRDLVFTTTNGTRAFLAVAEAGRVVSASFPNLSAAARAVADSARVIVLCAGRSDRFSMDDALCAGYLVRRIVGLSRDSVEYNDAARAAAGMADTHSIDAAFLERTAAGHALVEVGLSQDLPICADVDRHALTPRYIDRRIVLP